MPSTILKSGEFKSGFATAWREVVETGGPLVVTSSGHPEFAIFPVTDYVPLIYASTVLRIARMTYFKATGKEEIPEGYETVPPYTTPDALRTGMGQQRRFMRSMMTPFNFLYFRQLAGILFPIPHDGGMEMIDKLVEAWNETLDTVLG